MGGPLEISANFVSEVLDEIALEGLDGITTEALWMRLSVRQKFGIKIDENSKKFLWGIIIRIDDVKFYEIPKPRSSLRYYDYTKIKDSHSAVLELDEVYPYCSVKNVPGIFGSCQDYFTRVDITTEVTKLTLAEVNSKWGNKLVIVASQEIRNSALLGSLCAPNLDFTNVPIHYEILERIGRCRHLGLTTCGKASVQSVVEDSKSIFHYLKFLVHNKLIKKHSLFGSLHLNTNASQLYLPRFFDDISTEHLSILQMAVQELKLRPPHYMMPCEDFYSLFDAKNRKKVKKYRKTAMFKKYIELIKQNLPCEKSYFNESQSELELKSNTGNRTVSCFKLINPQVQITEVKDCDAEDEESISGFLPKGIYYKNMPMATQAYYHIKKSGTKGCTHVELGKILGLNKRLIRVLIKRLVNQKLCKFYIESEGRKRYKRYIVGEVAQMKAAASEIAQILSQNTRVDPEPGAANLPQLQHKENMSYRTLRRIGMIIKTIKANRFRLFHQILKHVTEEEIKEGLTTRVDRVTIFKILMKLENDELIKTITLTGGKDETGHVVKVYADPTFQLDEKLGEALYHTHSSYYLLDQKSSEEGQLSLEQEFSNTLIENLAEMKKMMVGVDRNSDKDSNPGLPRGGELAYSPKFIRLSIIHELICHLVYDYTGVVDRSQEELVEELSKTTAVDEELRKEMPNLYGSQVSTYMFVPPLNNSGKLPGWFLVSDLLVRMPLSVMVKVTRVSETCHDLWKYLHHPVRKHFLVKDLPLSIRQIFFSGKQSISAFYCDLKRLCFIGLLQFGSKFGREYYQTFAYMNRKASLLDTCPSFSEYFQIPPGGTFQVKSYYFTTKSDVKSYWMDMFNICMGTSFGGKRNAIGKEVLTERELSKESLKRFAEPKSLERVKEDDNGSIPGDNLGAAGLDSVLFSYLRSNWSGAISKKETPTEERVKKIPLQKLKKEQKKGKVPFKSRRKMPPAKSEAVAKEKPRKPKKSKEKEKEECFKKRRKIYDEVDLEALKLMNTLRVTWSTAEDNLLLVCRVAMTFLCPNSRTFVRIPWAEVQRVLRLYLPESRNKTQKAIARRIIYMLKNPTTCRSVNLCLEELKEMPEANEKFACFDLLKSIRPSAPQLQELQKQLYEKFGELVAFLKDRFIDSNGLTKETKNQDLIPDTLEEFLEVFQLEAPSREEVDIKSIRENVIRAILMSSLSCRADKTSSAVQLFDIYRQYDDDELQNALKKLHSDKVITISKPGASVFKRGTVLPLSYSPYKLSFAFQHMLTMKYTHSIYAESFSQMSKLLERREGEEFEIDLNECNLALFLLASKDSVSFRTVIPDQIIALDSGDPSDSNYSKMLERYCKMLSFSGSNSKVVCSSGNIISKSDDWKALEKEAKKRKLMGRMSHEAKRARGDEDDDDDDENEDEDEDEEEEEEAAAAAAAANDNEAVDEDGRGTRKPNDEEAGKVEKGEEQPVGSEKTTRSSRVILYLMREEAQKDAKNDLKTSAQEFCVVNSSKVFCKVKTRDLEMCFREMEPWTAAAIVKNIVGRSLVPINLVSEESVLGESRGGNEAEATRAVLDFISSKKELGATTQELVSNCHQETLGTILRILTKSKIVIKSGITETRYICQKYSTPWLLSSFKLTRLDREKVKPNDLTAVSLTSDEVPKKKMKGVISSEVLKSDEYIPPAGSSDKKVKLIIRPWIRIDGSLNRKVLDRFLGTILAFVMSNPGSSMRVIMNKFSPSITPVWTKDLIEILFEIGCVSLTVLRVIQKASLFSKSIVDVSENYTGLEKDECVLVEAKIDAVTTLGLFIGKKTYSKDFLVD